MYHRTTLGNGLRVVLEEIPHVRSVSVGCWVGAGSRYETEENHGISHLIEHLLFKGTAKRSAKQIAEQIDAVGGQLNAFTGREFTCYYAKLLDQHLPLAVDLLSDMLLCSLLDPGEVEKEKKVVIEEIKLYEDTPEELVHDLFTQAVYRAHPLGRTVLGTAAVMERIAPEAVRDYFGAHYTPDNMVIAVAGNIDAAQTTRLLEDYFLPMAGRRRPFADPRPGAGGAVLVKDKETEQVHLCVGTPGVHQNHKDFYTVHVLNSILGGGPSSRLFQLIREERSLAYSIYSYPTAYRDTGLFTVYAGVSVGSTQTVTDLVLQELSRVREEEVRQSELARAKEQLKGSLMLSLESTSNRMTRLGKSELYLGRILTPDEILAQIDRVTALDVARVARELFREENFTLAAVGNLGGRVDFSRFFPSVSGGVGGHGQA